MDPVLRYILPPPDERGRQRADRAPSNRPEGAGGLCRREGGPSVACNRVEGPVPEQGPQKPEEGVGLPGFDLRKRGSLPELPDSAVPQKHEETSILGYQDLFAGLKEPAYRRRRAVPILRRIGRGDLAQDDRPGFPLRRVRGQRGSDRLGGLRFRRQGHSESEHEQQERGGATGTAGHPVGARVLDRPDER